MANQKTFRKQYAEQLNELARQGESASWYGGEAFPYDESQVVMIPSIEQPVGLLEKMIPTSEGDCESAIALYEAYPTLTPLVASDKSFWTYLNHVDLFPYMQARNPRVLEEGFDDANYIVNHWFFGEHWTQRVTLAALWWMVHLTVDANGKDKYRYTRFFFSNYEFRTNFANYTISRHKEALIGYFEFLIDNPQVTKQNFKFRNRFITKHLNKLGGSRLLSTLPRSYFYEELERIKPQIMAITKGDSASPDEEC